MAVAVEVEEDGPRNKGSKTISAQGGKESKKAKKKKSKSIESSSRHNERSTKGGKEDVKETQDETSMEKSKLRTRSIDRGLEESSKKSSHKRRSKSKDIPALAGADREEVSIRRDDTTKTKKKCSKVADPSLLAANSKHGKRRSKSIDKLSTDVEENEEDAKGKLKQAKSRTLSLSKHTRRTKAKEKKELIDDKSDHKIKASSTKPKRRSNSKNNKDDDDEEDNGKLLSSKHARRSKSKEDVDKVTRDSKHRKKKKDSSKHKGKKGSKFKQNDCDENDGSKSSSEDQPAPTIARRGKKEEIISARTVSSADEADKEKDSDDDSSSSYASFSWEDEDEEGKGSTQMSEIQPTLQPVACEPAPKENSRQRGPNGLFLSRQNSNEFGRILKREASEEDIFAALSAEEEAIEEEKAHGSDEELQRSVSKKLDVQKWKASVDESSSSETSSEDEVEEIDLTRSLSLSTHVSSSRKPLARTKSLDAGRQKKSRHRLPPERQRSYERKWKPGQKVKAMDASELREMLKLKDPPKKSEAWRDSRWFRDEDADAAGSRLHGLSAFPVLTDRPSTGRIVTKANGRAYKLRPDELEAVTAASNDRRSEVKDALSAYLKNDSFNELNYTIH